MGIAMRSLFRLPTFAQMANKRLNRANLKLLNLNDKTEYTMSEVKQAYVKAAKKNHPDVSKDPLADDKFKKITAAYKDLQEEILNPQKYNQSKNTYQQSNNRQS